MRLGLIGILLLPAVAFGGDSDKDGIANGKDACRTEPETVNGYADGDGCPDALATVKVAVVDLEGTAVADARVDLGGAIATTDATGVATFADRMPGTSAALKVTAPGYLDQDLGETELFEGPQDVVATMDWLPVKVYVRARDPIAKGPVDANVRLDGPGFVDPQRTGDDGEVVIELRPGGWKLTVYADHYLKQVVDVPLKPAAAPVAVDVDLQPAWTAFESIGVSFDAGDATLSDSAKKQLDGVAGDLLAWDDVRLEVQGFEDPGRPDLSAARAEAVRAWLVSQGIPEGQLVVHGVGEADLAGPALSPDGRILNRRVAVVAIAGDGLADAIGHPVVLFAPGSAELADPAPLAAVVTALKANPAAKVDLVGHSAPSDRLLDRARAAAVVAYLEERTVPPGRLYAVGKGAPTEPRGAGFRVLGEDERVALPEAVYFDKGATDAAIPEAVADLTARARMIGDGRLLLLGHSDAGESTTLARRRADGVRTALIEAGIAADRVETRSLGDDLVAEDGASPFNRRVDVLVVPRPVIRDLRVEFAPESSTVDDAQLPVVQQVAAVLARNPTARLKVRGVGTSADGAAAPSIGVQRAGRVLTWLVTYGANLGNLEPGGVATKSSGGGFVAFELASVSVGQALAFEAGGSTVVDAHEELLGKVLAPMFDFPEIRYEVRGFAGPADAAVAGPKADLGELALRRAEACVRWLVRHGADPSHLNPVGATVTSTDPALPDARVEFVVTSPGT